MKKQNKKNTIGELQDSELNKMRFFAKQKEYEKKMVYPIEFVGTQYKLYYCHHCGQQITGSFHRVVHEEICCVNRDAPKKDKKYRVKAIRLRYFHPACFPKALDLDSEYRALFT